MEKQPLTATRAASSIKKLPKFIVALQHLVSRSMIEPEALQLYGDTCLHSTISTLSNEHDIQFTRVPERYGVHDARFTRYTLKDSSILKAKQLIAHYERRLRNA